MDWLLRLPWWAPPLAATAALLLLWLGWLLFDWHGARAGRRRSAAMIDEKKMAAAGERLTSPMLAQQKEGSGQWVGRLVSWDGCCGRWMVAHVEHAGGTEWLHLRRRHPKVAATEYVVAPARQCHAVTGASEQEAAAVAGEGPQAEEAPAYSRGSPMKAVAEATAKAIAQARERIAQEAPPIELGDVVRLKSGGPFMTVTSVEGKLAHCDVFLGAGPFWRHVQLPFGVFALERRPAEDPRQAGG